MNHKSVPTLVDECVRLFAEIARKIYSGDKTECGQTLAELTPTTSRQ